MKFFVPGIKRYETELYKQSSPHCFAPISLTGPHCELMCSHCRGSLLKFMFDARRDGLFATAARLKEMGTRGVLITGGSNLDGIVPLAEHADDIGRIVRDLGLRVTVHTGFVDEETASLLAKADIDSAMLDVVGSADTIKGVLGLDAGVERFEESLMALRDRSIKTVPHIVAGLDHGRIIGEHEALRIISRCDVDALVMLVLMPLAGTPMEGVEGPEISELRELFVEARELMKDKPVHLGCARPAGVRGTEIGKLAIECGFDGIAFPSEDVARHAEKLGRCPSYVENCCSI
jgi:hypothetical protein